MSAGRRAPYGTHGAGRLGKAAYRHDEVLLEEYAFMKEQGMTEEQCKDRIVPEMKMGSFLQMLREAKQRGDKRAALYVTDPMV